MYLFPFEHLPFIFYLLNFFHCQATSVWPLSLHVLHLLLSSILFFCVSYCGLLSVVFTGGFFLFWGGGGGGGGGVLGHPVQCYMLHPLLKYNNHYCTNHFNSIQLLTGFDVHSSFVWPEEGPASSGNRSVRGLKNCCCPRKQSITDLFYNFFFSNLSFSNE